MNLSPLHAITNVGVLLGGQASAWQKNLAAFGTDSYIRTQLENLIDAAQLKIAPVVREVSQIVPGGLTRLRQIIAAESADDIKPEEIDAEPAVSVPGILLGEIAAVTQLGQLGFTPEKYTAYGHSQGVLGVECLTELPGDNWADDEKLVNYVAFAFLLGAAASQATFGRMMSVQGVPVELLPIAPGVINSPIRAVYSGDSAELAAVKRAVTAAVDKYNATIDTHERGGEHVDVTFADLGVKAAFHHEHNREAVAQAVEWSEKCGLNAVDAQRLGDYILVDPYEWKVGEHDYLLTLDKALGQITSRHRTAQAHQL